MDTPAPATAYARLSPPLARAVLVAAALLVAFCLAARPTPPPTCDTRDETQTTGDVALYWAEVQRIHAGEDYYQVAAEELVARGYPTRSVFNWRTPLPIWLIGKLPDPVMAKVLLGLLALALLMLAFEAAAREQSNVFRLALPLIVLMAGPLLPCVLGKLYVMPVLWAGVLIGISLAAYGIGRPYLAATAGLAAVFFRELALPYCVLAAALACWRRQWRELAVWTVGLAGWAAFFALHWLRVSQFIGPEAQGHREGWIQFGGTTFVLATTQMNTCLLLAPTWVTVLYFTAAMLGLAGWSTPLGLRTVLTVCLYIVAFSIAGQDFNRYWGLIVAPLLCFGVVRCPASLADLWKAAKWKPRESRIGAEA